FCSRSPSAHRLLPAAPPPASSATFVSASTPSDRQSSWPHTPGVADAVSNRRKQPHTTHHQDLPASVTITRSHHAFEGQSLVVDGRVHRQGRAHLLLVLPDGSRSLIPAEWTDLRSSEDTPVANPSSPRISLAPLSD